METFGEWKNFRVYKSTAIPDFKIFLETAYSQDVLTFQCIHYYIKQARNPTRTTRWRHSQPS